MQQRWPSIYTILVAITIFVALYLVIFAVQKVFNYSPFTLPSYAAFYIIVLTVFVFFFPLTRTYLEYRTLKLLADKGELHGYVTQFLSDTESAEDSIIAVKEEVRFVIALAIILILGIALFHLMTIDANNEYVKSISAVFIGAITTIVGFYFGAKISKEGGAKPTKFQTDAKLIPTVLTVNADPQSVKAGGKISITGILVTTGGKVLPNKPIKLEKSVSNDEWVDTGFSPVTDNKGNYNQDVETEQADQGKLVQFKARFIGDSTYDKTENITTVHIE